MREKNVSKGRKERESSRKLNLKKYIVMTAQISNKARACKISLVNEICRAQILERLESSLPVNKLDTLTVLVVNSLFMLNNIASIF